MDLWAETAPCLKGVLFLPSCTSAFDLLAGVEIVEKQNLASRIAHLAPQAVTHNKRRHDELQRFMLTTDSVTVAVEVPIYLTPALSDE
jgi:hypothetical protein